MPSRLPVPSDLPSELASILHPSPLPSPSSVSNIVIFLHGLGDTSRNFSSFASALNLPATLTLTLQASSSLPFPFPPDQGYHWADDIILDSGTGDLDPDAGFTKARKLVGEDVIRKLLMEKCGFRPREILIFGFGQGGMVALAVAKDLGAEAIELGGVISLGGALPQSSRLISGEKSRTPVLLFGGGKGVFSESAVKAVQGTFQNVETRLWQKRGDDGMPRNREETMPMMQFFARRLRSRQGVPEGAVEIG